MNVFVLLTMLIGSNGQGSYYHHSLDGNIKTYSSQQECHTAYDNLDKDFIHVYTACVHKDYIPIGWRK
jgi:hypothetical protein